LARTARRRKEVSEEIKRRRLTEVADEIERR